MVSSSYCIAFVSVALMLQFLLSVSASASAPAPAPTPTSIQYVDGICNNVENVTDKAFCVNTLKSHPPMAKVTDKFKAVRVVLRLGMSYADKYANVTEKATKMNPKLKNHYKGCQDAYMRIKANFNSASMELKEAPDSSNYDVLVSFDQTAMIKNLVGNYTDKASTSVMRTTLMMNKLITVAVAATVSVGG